MEDRATFHEQLTKQGLDSTRIDAAINEIDDYIEFCGGSEEHCTPICLQDYCRQRMAGSEEAFERIIALIRYYGFKQQLDEMAYLITMLGTIGVIESQRESLINLTNSVTDGKVFDGLKLLPLGTPQEDYPPLIADYIARLRNVLTEDICRKVLAGNHHRIPDEHFKEHTKYFAESGNIDEFLKWRHKRLIDELQEHCDSGQLWYEQRITPEVVEFVKHNPEIESGVREGNRIYITKIPYNPDAYLKEKDPVRKSYLACHCPFVRTALLDGRKVPSLWCYCTGGYEKQPFDLIYGQTLDVEVLESLLDGAPRCRFAIVIPDEAIPKR